MVRLGLRVCGKVMRASTPWCSLSSYETPPMQNVYDLCAASVFWGKRSASPTWRIRGGVSAEVVDYQRNRLQGLHYRAGETEGFGDVILGGGWGGNTSFRRSKSIWTSDSGWV